MTFARFFFDWTFTSAAVSVVLPWSMWPIVPTFTWVLLRTNFSLPMIESLSFESVDRVPSVPLHLRDDLFLDRRRDRRVVRELHGGRPASLGHRAQVSDVTEHRRERYLGVDDLRVAALGHAENAPATRVEVADDVTHVLLGDDDLDLHQGLEDHDAGAPGALLEAEGRCDLERLGARVDLVVAAVGQPAEHVDEREAGDDAAGHRLADALLDRRDELLRDHAADDVVR